MEWADYLARHARRASVEVFRGQDLPADLPEHPGLYAWYGRPSPLPRSTDPAELQQALAFHTDRRFRRSDYKVTVSASLEPMFEGTVSHRPNDERAGEPPTPSTRVVRSLSRFLDQAYLPFFAPPLYVGKAIEQSVAARVRQHVSAMRRAERLAATTSPSDEDVTGHSFAADAVARGFRVEDMLLLTWTVVDPCVDMKDAITRLEFAVNRIAYPICGHR